MPIYNGVNESQFISQYNITLCMKSMRFTIFPSSIISYCFGKATWEKIEVLTKQTQM